MDMELHTLQKVQLFNVLFSVISDFGDQKQVSVEYTWSPSYTLDKKWTLSTSVSRSEGVGGLECFWYLALSAERIECGPKTSTTVLDKAFDQ